MVGHRRKTRCQKNTRIHKHSTITLNRITDYNNQTEEERSALDPIKWYGTFKTQLAEIDRKSYGKSVPRDEKKLAPFITRIKTQIVNDIATTGNLSKEEKKKVSKMIALPSRCFVTQMRTQAMLIMQNS